MTRENVIREGGTPPGWSWTTLGEVATVLDSQRVPINADEREQRIAHKKPHEVYPYFGATGQVGWIDSYLFDEELVLLGEDGAPFLDPGKNKAYIIKGRCWVNNHAHVLRANAGFTLNSYLMHFLNFFDYHGYVTGTTRFKLNQSEMRKIPIPLAPLLEQRRIVAEIEKQFTRLDAGVAALKRVQANLKRYRASVLKAACEGRLAPQDPADEPADRLLARILAERRAKWEAEHPGKKYVEPAAAVTDGLPALPVGWCWSTISSVTVLGPQNGLYLPQSAYGSGIPILRIDDYQNGSSRASGELRLVRADDDEIKKYRLFENDLVINRVNSLSHLGKCLLVSPRNLPAIFESNMMRLRLASGVAPTFVEKWLQSNLGRSLLTQRAKWAVNQASINQEDIGITPVPIPPHPEQHRIVAEVERRLSVVAEVEAAVVVNLARAGRLRQAVLKRAFEGKLWSNL